MELFSEIYNCYYQVLRHLLCSQAPLTIDKIRRQICEEGFGESLLSIIPKLESGSWNLFRRDGVLYFSKLSPSFLNSAQTETLQQMLSSVTPLWKQGQFSYFDQFTDGDPFTDPTYRSHFRTLLQAIKEKKYVDIDYNSPTGHRIHHYYVPARLEYSVKNDKFRLLALKASKNNNMRLEILNVSRMERINLTENTFTSTENLNAIIQGSYYK